MTPEVLSKMISEVQRTILRLRIACYLTNHGHMDKWLISEIAFFLSVSELIGTARWPRSRPTAITKHAMNAILNMVSDDCRWCNQEVRLLDEALLRAEWVFIKRPEAAAEAAKAGDMVRDAIIDGSLLMRQRATCPTYITPRLSVGLNELLEQN